MKNEWMPGYAFLNPPKTVTIAQTNQLREHIGLRPVELRNKLVDIEKETGMNFYLPDWVKGKIHIERSESLKDQSAVHQDG